MLLFNLNINVAIAVILMHTRKVSKMLKSWDGIIADAMWNLARAPILQSSNSCKNFHFSSMNLKLCTLIIHDQVKTIVNFQYNYSHIRRDMALQS